MTASNPPDQIKTGEWFSICVHLRCPIDGSWVGDLHRADIVEGDFISGRRFQSHGGRGEKFVYFAPHYRLQRLSNEFVLQTRPELHESLLSQ